MELSSERIVLANPVKTCIIAEAQIKTDKVDARILKIGRIFESRRLKKGR